MQQSLSDTQRLSLEEGYLRSLESTQRVVSTYLRRLDEVLASADWQEEGQWQSLFGAKETPLTALQKLLAVQKVAGDLWEKAARRMEANNPQSKPGYRLKEEDWRILKLALKHHEAQKKEK